MDQYGVHQSTRMIHSPNSYTADLYNKLYNTGTLYMNVFEPSTTVMSKEDTMIHFLGVAMIQKFIRKKGPKKFVTRGENSVTK